MKKLLLETNLSKIYVIVMILISLFLIGGYFSSAMFTVSKEKKNAISIVTGNLDYKITINDKDTNIITIPKGSIMNYKVVLSNPNNISARFNIAYKEREGVVLGYIETSENIPPIDMGINLEKDETAGSSNIYNLRVRNETSEDVEIELVVKVGLDYNDLTIDEDKRIIGKYEDVLLKDFIMTLRNEDNNTDYSTSSEFEQKQMYTFNHTAGSQQNGWTKSELTDYRYIGNTTNNYIEFNEELWRIIGVFTVLEKDGSKEQLLKLVREAKIGNYAYDNRNQSTGALTVQGSSDWPTSRLMKLLNPGYTGTGGSRYYNSGNGSCYVGQNNATVACNFTNTGIKDKYKKYIKDVKYFLGGTVTSTDAYKNLSGSDFYTLERNNEIYGSNSIYWYGKIGLIYPSDYVYTFANGVDETCFDKNYQCNNGSNESSYFFNNPVLISEDWYWTITPQSNISYANIYIHSYGHLYGAYYSYGAGAVLPTLYLDSSLIVTNGNGTRSLPYVILVN